MCSDFSRRWRRFPHPVRPAQPRGRVGVLVTQWLGTGVPLFNLEIALMLAGEGFHVTAICDETDVVGNAPEASHSPAIRRIVEQLSDALDVVDVGALPPGTPDETRAAAILQSNAIWRMRGEANAGQFLEKNPTSLARIAEHLGRVEALLQSGRFDWILVPGGIFGLSGIYTAASRATGVPFTTYDAAVGVFRLAHDGIAAHLGDLPRAYASLEREWQSDSRIRGRVLEVAQSEIDDRMHSRDFRQFQLAAASQRDDLQYDILVPLNIRWDSAALSRQRIFASVEEWLLALLSWVESQPDVTICIRQHPRERLDFAKGSDDWGPLLARFAHLGPRVRFVAAQEEINSYDLLRHAKVVLPHTSTFGIEAAFLGKPAALATDCYYGDLGFVRSAGTREEYFQWISEAIAGALTISPRQSEDAGFAYFLTQRCAYVRSVFNPHREQFIEWVHMSPEALWATPETEDVRTALLNREPLSVVRYRRLISL